MTIPSETVELIGYDKISEVIAYKAHDAFVVDGDDLNHLAALARRLTIIIPLDGKEAEKWAAEVLRIVDAATPIDEY
jgi:hypothetical protein